MKLGPFVKGLAQLLEFCGGEDRRVILIAGDREYEIAECISEDYHGPDLEHRFVIIAETRSAQPASYLRTSKGHERKSLGVLGEPAQSPPDTRSRSDSAPSQSGQDQAQQDSPSQAPVEPASENQPTVDRSFRSHMKIQVVVDGKVWAESEIDATQYTASGVWAKVAEEAASGILMGALNAFLPGIHGAHAERLTASEAAARRKLIARILGS